MTHTLAGHNEFGAYLTPFGYLVLLAAALAVLSLLVLLSRLGARLADARERQAEPADVLARRAAQLRTRPLRMPKRSGSFEYIELLRVVPVMQRGQLARPIVVRDWR